MIIPRCARTQSHSQIAISQHSKHLSARYNNNNNIIKSACYNDINLKALWLT